MNNPEAKINVLYLKDSSAPFFSVHLLQDSISSSLSNKVNLKTISAGESDGSTCQRLLENTDIILGLDRTVLRTRKNLRLAIPLLMPSYGLGTRGMLPIWEFRELLLEGDGFLCPSTADKNAALKHLKDDQIKLHLLPYCLSPEMLDDSPQLRKSDFLSKYNLPQEPDIYWLLYAGRINQQKNVHLLFSILSHIHTTGKNAHLLIAGSEDKSNFPELNWNNAGYLDDLKKQVENTNLTDQVHFLGDLDQTNLKAAYQFASINITCSTFRTEDFGFVPIEAMAQSLPTVGTAWGGFWDTVEDGITGFRMPVYITDSGVRVDWLTGAKLTSELLDNKLLYEQVRANGRKIALMKYHPDTFSQALLEIMKKAISEFKKDAASLNLSKLLDKDSLEYFSEIKRGLSKGKSLLEAREGLFVDSKYKRLKSFWGAYSNLTKLKEDVDGFAYYRPLDIDIQNDSVLINDRNWPRAVKITSSQAKILRVLQSEKDLTQITEATGISPSSVIKAIRILLHKGLILPVNAL